MGGCLKAEVAVAAAWRPAAGQDLRLLNPKRKKKENREKKVHETRPVSE